MKLAIFLAFAGAPLSSAENLDFCEPVASINRKASGCVDNEVTYAEAAVVCLNKFSREVEVLGSQLSESLFGNTGSAASAKNQARYFNGAGANYLLASSRLSLLLGKGKRALAQVKEYEHNLNVPEDYEVAGTMGFSPESFLESIPCFSENKKVLRHVHRDLASKISSIERARAASLIRAASASSSKANLIAKGEVSTAITAAPVDSGKNAVKPGKKITKNSASDITGTKEKSASIR